jgi:hypothetical protein
LTHRRTRQRARSRLQNGLGDLIVLEIEHFVACGDAAHADQREMPRPKNRLIDKERAFEFAAGLKAKDKRKRESGAMRPQETLRTTVSEM